MATTTTTRPTTTRRRRGTVHAGISDDLTCKQAATMLRKAAAQLEKGGDRLVQHGHQSMTGEVRAYVALGDTAAEGAVLLVS